VGVEDESVVGGRQGMDDMVEEPGSGWCELFSSLDKIIVV
jgi:hypothetical protein